MHSYIVSILILMEVHLEVTETVNGFKQFSCFNPYFNGSTFRRRQDQKETPLKVGVSILILMEVHLEDGFEVREYFKRHVFQSLF